MALKLYSKTLSRFNGVITNDRLTNSITLLKLHLKSLSLQILTWDETHIAIPLRVDVSLPPRRDIDIRERENIILVVNLEQYPQIPPRVHTDRLDFPKNDLAHLYIAAAGRPPAFCLVRGDLASWYATKHLKDLVIRTRNWLSDAASGMLSENSDQFDPLRLEGYRGNVVYKYHEFASLVKDNKSIKENTNFHTAIFENTGPTESLTFVFKNFITAENIDESFKLFQEAKEKYQKQDPTARKIYVGYVVWDREETTHSSYNVALPKTWGQLKAYANAYGVDFQHVERFICDINLDYRYEIPFIVGIRRPKQLIGFNSDIEFVNFYLFVKVDDKGETTLNDDVAVYFQRHNEANSIEKAIEVSGKPYNLGRSMIFGCGALGSKIIMHFARNGYTDFVLVDPDKISTHNMTRHALLAGSIGMNKAAALISQIKALYPYDKLPCYKIEVKGEFTITEELKPIIEKRDWLFDFTASESFLHMLVNPKIPIKPRICRTFLTNFGGMGVTLIEGNHRTPRVDDLLNELYFQALCTPVISQWLINEREMQNDTAKNITVGVGCNTETTVLSDEIISFHAAYHSSIFKITGKNDPSYFQEGHIFISDIGPEGNISDFSPIHFRVAPYFEVRALKDPSWQIRYRSGLILKMKAEMGKAMPSETGGVFVGAINYKTKTIHVVDIVEAPSDSFGNPGCFFRGVQNLPERIDYIQEKTGGQLGYIGEWHTHPFGPHGLSRIDMAAISRFKSEFSQLTSPMPVFITVLTPEALLSYVF